jgi:hypothetical protein
MAIAEFKFDKQIDRLANKDISVNFDKVQSSNEKKGENCNHIMRIRKFRQNLKTNSP